MSQTPHKPHALGDVFHQFDVLQTQNDNQSLFAYHTARDITNVLQSPQTTPTVKRQIVSEMVDAVPVLLQHNQENAFQLFINTMAACVADPDMQVGHPIERRGVSAHIVKSGNLALVSLNEIAAKIESGYPQQSKDVREKLSVCNLG